MFGLAALVMVFGLVFSLSAFRNPSQRGTTVYYKYNGSTFNEAAYRNMANWQHIDDPEEAECGGETYICILKVDSDNLSGTGSLLDQLDDFFDNQLPNTGDVNSYVNNTANIEAQQN